MSFKPILKRAAEKIAPGRTPSYGEAQILRTLEIVAGGSIGRAALGVRLGIGEGVVRTLTRRLSAEGLIEVSTSGICVSEKGKRLLREAHIIIGGGAVVPATDDTVGRHNYALLVRGVTHKVRFGIEQRDAALLVGAKGATTIVSIGGLLLIPGMDRAPTRVLQDSIGQLNPQEGDAIIIGTGENEIEAEIGAYAAALTLV